MFTFTWLRKRELSLNQTITSFANNTKVLLFLKNPKQMRATQKYVFYELLNCHKLI